MLKVIQQCLLRLAIKNFLKKHNQIWKRVEKLLKIEFDSEPAYGDNEKYIKTKKNKNKNIYWQYDYKFLEQEYPQRKCTIQVIGNNARFCYQSKKKYYPQILLEECEYEQEKIKMENLIDDDLEKRCSDESDSESDKGNDECNEQFVKKLKTSFNNNKNLIVCFNHAL